VSPSDQRTSAVPTNLFNHPTDGSSINCLAQAARCAREGMDEIVFLSAPAAHAGAAGHVVLRDRQTGIVREPGDLVDEACPPSIEAYLKVSGRSLLAMLPAALVRGLLRFSPQQRATAMAELGEPLVGIAHLAFGIAAVPPVVPNNNTNKSHPSTEATDTHAKDWLDAMGNAVSDSDKAALAQTGNDAQTLLNWFDSFKRGDPKLNDMPQPIADAENRLLSNDAVAKQLTVNGQVTRDAIGSFLKNLDSSADSAKSSWQAFQKDNKTPDPIAKQEAVDTSILQGNVTILDAAGGPNAKVDSKFNADDLKAVASGTNDAQLPQALKNAAAFYANPGEFSNLANAGLDASTTSDGTVKNSNLDALLSKGTSKSEDDTISGLKSAAVQQAVAQAGGDASKLDPSYFTTGQSNASGADKAAALVQLSQTIGRLNAGMQQFKYSGPDVLNSPDQYNQYYDGPTPGQQESDFITQVQGRINTLSQDPDVASFLNDAMPKSLSTIVQSDPGMTAAVKTQSDKAISSQALQDAFGQKDSNGKPLSTTDALGSFVGKANFYWQALGGTGTPPNYNQALTAAPQDIQQKVKAGYNDIVSGNEITTLVNGGMSQDAAIDKSASDKTVYDSVLDPTTVQAGTDQFTDVVTSLGRANLTDNVSISDMLKGLGISSGDVNDPKLQQFITDNLNSIDPSGNGSISAAAVFSALRQINDSARGGLKFDDSIAKAQKAWNLPGGTPLANGMTAEAYKAGVFHAASAVLLAGAMGFRLHGDQGTDLQTAGQSLGIAGLLTEGGGKAYATTLKGLDSTVKGNAPAWQALKDQLLAGHQLTPQQLTEYGDYKAQSDSLNLYKDIGKQVENTGKLLGGVAGNALGFAAGVIGAINSAKSGNTGDAAAQGIFAGLNGISTIASAGEIAAWIAPRISSLVTSTTAEALGGVFGAVGGAVGGIAAVGGLIYAIIKGIQEDNKIAQQENAWYKELQAGFAPSGITLPDLGTLLSPPNGTIPNNNPPVEE
jgi:Type III secretion system translocator protein, HrpF